MMPFELEELESLKHEFEWLLNEEVNVILSQLHQLLLECSRRFSIKIDGLESLTKNETFALVNTSSSQQVQLKITGNITADDITNANLAVRLPKHSSSEFRFTIQSDFQWKLHQIQDASNHLMAALNLLDNPPLRFDEETDKYDFHSSDEVIQMINDVMCCLQKGRNSLINPQKPTISELQSSRNMKTLQPSVPNDLAISFFIQSHKLICAVHHKYTDQQSKKIRWETSQAETSIPWLSEVLVLFTVALQFCQQLKDKVTVFNQYSDMQKASF